MLEIKINKEELEAEIRKIISKVLHDELSKVIPASYTKAEVCRMLGITYPTLQKLTETGKLKVNEIGKIPHSEIIRFTNKVK